MGDERGSVLSVTDGSGATIGLNAYDENGIPAASNSGRFGYTGQSWLAGVNMWYYKARVYSPTLGRFLQSDPIGYGDGLNWYNYVGGDPVNFSDPSGLAVDEIVVTGVRYTPPIATIWNPFASRSLLALLRPERAGLECSWACQIDREFQQRFLTMRRVDDDGEVAGSPQSGHDYRASKEVCRRTLTNTESRDLISRFTVPNSNAGLPSGEGYHVVDYAGIPGGVVYTTFSSDGLAGRNVTTPVHALVGTVDQTIVNRGGAAYLNTHGFGSAGGSWFGRFRDGQNDSWGPVIFDNVGSKAALYAAAHYKGC